MSLKTIEFNEYDVNYIQNILNNWEIEITKNKLYEINQQTFKISELEKVKITLDNLNKILNVLNALREYFDNYFKSNYTYFNNLSKLELFQNRYVEIINACNDIKFLKDFNEYGVPYNLCGGDLTQYNHYRPKNEYKAKCGKIEEFYEDQWENDHYVPYLHYRQKDLQLFISKDSLLNVYKEKHPIITEFINEDNNFQVIDAIMIYHDRTILCEIGYYNKKYFYDISDNLVSTEYISQHSDYTYFNIKRE